MKILKEMFSQQNEGEATPAIMGVCSYFANRFHLDVLAVRITTAGGAYLFASTSRAILAYIAIGVILSFNDSSSEKQKKKRNKLEFRIKKSAKNDHQSHNQEQKKEEVSEADAYHPTLKLSRISVRQLDRKLKRLEHRVAKLELSITSGHLKMARDFRDLNKRSEESTTN
ncbi:hypothetical protein ACH42_11200 [Endozoicomonas sp. (ex Bugula neritina AB1)]|nr:hypothetical protein ACH42_11200 [Endozoicomonas sp. (ex Bugula neritina AB1)]